MILGEATDRDSNWERKAHNHQLESFGVDTERGQVEDPINSLGPTNLQGLATPHDDTLVIRATIVNYDVTQLFID